MKLKICGMKHPENIKKIAALQPDYMGFIFYQKSSRYFNGTIPELNKNIKKTGVFVNETLAFVTKTIQKHQLQAVQLHGKESPEYCEALKPLGVEIIKVFSIKDTFNFKLLEPFETVCNYFLFDTKGKLPGGNGYTFNWDVLSQYPSSKPFFLSGGIGLDQVEAIKTFKKSKASKYCYALDVNSAFEIEPGLKNNEQLKEFKDKLCAVN